LAIQRRSCPMMCPRSLLILVIADSFIKSFEFPTPGKLLRPLHNSSDHAPATACLRHHPSYCDIMSSSLNRWLKSWPITLFFTSSARIRFDSKEVLPTVLSPFTTKRTKNGRAVLRTRSSNLRLETRRKEQRILQSAMKSVDRSPRICTSTLQHGLIIDDLTLSIVCARSRSHAGPVCKSCRARSSLVCRTEKRC
jgi:hypothetical protein